MCSSLALSLFLLSVSLHPFGFFHTFTFTRWCPPLPHEHVCVGVIVMLVVMGCICASVYPQWLQSKITSVMHAGCEWWFSAHRGTISQTQPLKPLHSFSACLSVSRNICLLIKVCLHSTVCLADGYIKKILLCSHLLCCLVVFSKPVTDKTRKARMKLYSPERGILIYKYV